MGSIRVGGLAMADIKGTIADARFEKMCLLLSDTLDSGEDVGASVCVTIDGETVVDIWGGHADEAKTTEWQQDTITNVWSTTKTMTFLSALLLVERGQLDFYAPVAHLLARVRPERQGRHRGPPSHGPHLGACQHGPSQSPPKTSTTGTSPPRCSRPRPRGGSPAPHRATTRSIRAT